MGSNQWDNLRRPRFSKPLHYRSANPPKNQDEDRERELEWRTVWGSNPPARRERTLTSPEVERFTVSRGSITVFMVAAIITISGCQSIPEVPRETLIPVATPCLSTDQLPIPPKLVTDAELLAMGDAAFVIALAADRLERIKYMAVTEALLTACVK